MILVYIPKFCRKFCLKVVDMVERRFSALAGQTMATMQMRLNIDPIKKQLSFRFGPDQRSSKVSFHSTMAEGSS